MKALITGASAGIGAELARVFAANGHDLILVARSEAALTARAAEFGSQYGVSVRAITADLSLPGAAERLWATAGAEGAVDILVNNAGMGLYGPLADHDPRALHGMLELNVVTLTALTRLALPAMLRRRAGRILNVASLAAYQPGGPWMAAYYATKSYVLSFTRGLAGELRGTGVSVTALCPGPTQTAFEERSGASRTRLYRQNSGPDAGAVARAGYRGVMRGRTVVVPGFFAKIMAIAGELPPRRIALEVNRFLLEPIV